MKTLFGERRGNPFENPSTPLTSVALLQMFGGELTDAGVSVDETTALTFSAVYRCVMLMAGLVGGFPLKAYRYADKKEISVRALQPQLAGTNTPFERWETVMLHLLLWGNAYLQKVRNPAGNIIDLRPIHPGLVAIQVQDGDKIFLIQQPASSSQVPRTNYEILHIPGPTLDGIKGISPIEQAKTSISIGIAGDKMAAKFFGKGALLSGILSTDRLLTQAQSDVIKSRWNEKMMGLGHGHDVAVLGAGTKFQPLSIPPDAAQFLQSRQWQVTDIARWFGVPPFLIGELTKSTSWGTGLEQINTSFLQYTLRPWLRRIEQRVTREVTEPSTQYAEFLVDELLRADTLSRYQAYQFALMNGWLTRNEVREMENREPIPGLDEPLVPTVAPPMSTVVATPDDEPDTNPEYQPDPLSDATPGV